MATNQDRRDAERAGLQRQLEHRERSAEVRRRIALVSSVLATVIVIVLVLVLIYGFHNNNDATPAASGGTTSTACTAGATSCTFEGVTVAKANDLTVAPQITSKGTTDPTTLEYTDLVTGTGAAATPASTVSVQYSGVLYKNGTAFDSSWKDTGKPVSFPLTQVVKGFTEGIGGTTGVPPMKVGGRRLMILPASLGYGSQASGPIPANSSLVFVVDLKKVS